MAKWKKLECMMGSENANSVEAGEEILKWAKLERVMGKYEESIKDETVLTVRSADVPKKKRKENKRETNTGCQHENTIKDFNTVICEDCGIEVDNEISFDQDWRYYGQNDSKNGSDPSRCQYRKSPEKGIKKELEQMGFPIEICEVADVKYKNVTRGDIKRSNLRKGIMYACVFETFKEKQTHRIPEELQEKFGLDKKSASKGITYYHTRCPKEQRNMESVTAEHYIPNIMSKFKAKKEHIDLVIELYTIIKDKSLIINRSNPQSTATGIVYYYLRKNKCKVNPGDFGKASNLSEGIIIKIAKEVSRLLETTDLVDLEDR